VIYLIPLIKMMFVHINHPNQINHSSDLSFIHPKIIIQMKLYHIAVIMLLAIITAHCGHTSVHEEHNPATEGHEHTADDHEEEVAESVPENPNAIVFTKEQQEKIDFATEEIKREAFGQVIRSIAQIQPSQGDERMLVAKTGGTVVFTANITEGKSVAAGQTLFSIDGSATADNNLALRQAEVKSNYELAAANYERKAALAKDNIVSQSDLLQAKTAFSNAEAAYNNLRRNFSAGKQPVASPIGGYVTSVLVGNGQFVEAGQPVLLVSQNRDLFLKAELPSKYFEVLGNITSANIRRMNSDRTFTLEELNGKVLSYGKSISSDNWLIPVTFQINNRAELLPGSFVEIFIKTQTGAQAITVANEAIVEEMGNLFVFVQLTDETFEKRLVQTAATDGIRTEINVEAGASRPIQPGERVVSKGAMMIKLSQASGALDAHAGHAH
jgi:RND family efflux transporter MFP subunit